MLALLQRVTQGKVTVDNTIISSIDKGYVILLGVFKEDNELDVEKLVEKIINLRIISDAEDKMNKSLLDVNGEILLVSQFTLCADTRKGRRPSFLNAKEPSEANRLYELMATQLREKGITVKTGQFGAIMNVEIHNDGPVTIMLNSKEL